MDAMTFCNCSCLSLYIYKWYEFYKIKCPPDHDRRVVMYVAAKKRVILKSARHGVDYQGKRTYRIPWKQTFIYADTY